MTIFEKFSLIPWSNKDLLIAEGDELEILARRVGEYEEQQFPIPPSEPFQEDKPGIDQRF